MSLGSAATRFTWTVLKGGAVTTPLERATWAYHYAGRLAGLYPYVYGGAHGEAPDQSFGGFPPTKGEDPEGTNPKGFDCSGWVSTLLWHAGTLGAQVALGTTELKSWGEHGPGKYVTVFVRDELQAGGVRHCLIRFTMPNEPVRWSVAAHTGTICGWAPYGSSYDPTVEGYVARHFAGE